MPTLSKSRLPANPGYRPGLKTWSRSVPGLYFILYLECTIRYIFHAAAWPNWPTSCFQNLEIFDRTNLFRLLEVASRSFSLHEVEVEGVFVVEVALYRVQVDQHVVKLLEEEVAGGHALASGDGVAFASATTYQLGERQRWRRQGSRTVEVGVFNHNF